MNDFKENIKWLLKFYRPLKRRLLNIALLSIFIALLNAIIPYTFIRIIDGIKEGLSIEYIIKSVLILLLLGTIYFIASYTNTTRRALTNSELEWHFRQNTFARILKLDQTFHERFRLGDIVTRLTDDVGEKLSWFACSGVFRAWESSLRVVFSLIAMFYINPWLAIVALIPFPIQILIYIRTTALLDKRFKFLQGVISRVNETIETCFSGIKIIQAYCMEQRQYEKFLSVATERADGEVSAEKSRILVHSLYEYFWQIANVLVLFTGGWMVINNKITIGEFVAFDYYVSHLVWPIFDISTILVGYRRASVSIRRLREIDDFAISVKSPEEPLPPGKERGRIIFRDVTLKRSDKIVLDKVSFDTRAYRMIGIVGEVGSGKSSLLNLLCRFYDPVSGEIIMDDVPLTRWKLSELRRRVGYVSQEPLLFTDTVSNNIRFGRDWIDEQKILSSSDISHLTEEVKAFSNGFDTSIGLRGMTVSGGQKQRISIARALAGSPEILILDDATSHLDAETEAALWDNVYNILPDMRIFLVSHRPSTLERADIILVLRDGKVVEEGKHQELLERKGEYYRIYSREKNVIG